MDEEYNVEEFQIEFPFEEEEFDMEIEEWQEEQQLSIFLICG